LSKLKGTSGINPYTPAYVGENSNMGGKVVKMWCNEIALLLDAKLRFIYFATVALFGYICIIMKSLPNIWV